MAVFATRSDLINFYAAVEATGLSDCDDVVFCGCGASWPVPVEYPGLRRTLNAIRLHRIICKAV